jgi:hypothetical protein
MDLTRPVTYRGLDINDVKQSLRVLRGFSIEQVDYSSVDAVGYTEKRATSDGIHASDVYLGPRQIDISGLIYASTLPELFDKLRLLRVVFSPTSAYGEDPVRKGFLPMHYQQTTLDAQSFPGGLIDLFMYARPRMLPRFTITRDRLVGFDKRPQAIPWAAGLIAKDPRVYIDPAQTIPLSGPAVGPPGTTAQAINRGDYESPLNIMLVAGSIAPPAGTFHLQGFDVDMTIKIEAKANVVYRWRGDDRTLMTQDALNPNAAEALRMDLVSFIGKNEHPHVPAEINPSQRPFSTPFTYTCSVPLAAGSRLFWNEAFA